MYTMAASRKLTGAKKATKKEKAPVVKSAVKRSFKAPKESNFILKEPDVAYGYTPRQSTLRMVHPEKSTDTGEGSVLIMKGDRPEHKMSSFEKFELIQDGISKKALQNLKEKAALDYDQLAQVLNVGRATLINKKGNEKFSQDLSDKILGLADIYSYGYEVFEDHARFNRWVFRPNQALGGQAPFDLLHNSFGREEVKNLIGRIDYGVYS
jgi:putative toxin-antitoxin system antitoxin component (TIGR02293 family)